MTLPPMVTRLRALAAVHRGVGRGDVVQRVVVEPVRRPARPARAADPSPCTRKNPSRGCVAPDIGALALLAAA
jgi:hypothetical protein